MSIAPDRESSLFLRLVTLEEPGVLRPAGEVHQLFTSFYCIDYNLLRAKIMSFTIISSMASGAMMDCS